MKIAVIILLGIALLAILAVQFILTVSFYPAIVPVAIVNIVGVLSGSIIGAIGGRLIANLTLLEKK